MIAEKTIKHFLETLGDYGCGDGEWMPQKRVMKDILELALKGLEAKTEEEINAAARSLLNLPMSGTDAASHRTSQENK